MKIIIAGGSGYLGSLAAAYYAERGAEVIILSRRSRVSKGNIRSVLWDGKRAGPWKIELEGAELLINLAGKSVDCRYNEHNKLEILESRVASVRALGQAISDLKIPPRCWIQSSTATIYRHAEDLPQDEFSGEAGEGFSVDVCRAWEKSFTSLELPQTRKIVLRTGIVLGNGGGAFPILKRLARLGLGGTMGRGTQYISWIHEADFIAVMEWLRGHSTAEGIYNCTAPWPLPNALFMQKLSSIAGTCISIRSPEWLLRIGAVIIGTETELILKSRWVKPTRLAKEGYEFQYPRADDALEQLLKR
jgi:uncharacterized protein (TIGR01777 family)